MDSRSNPSEVSPSSQKTVRSEFSSTSGLHRGNRLLPFTARSYRFGYRDAAGGAIRADPRP